MVHLPHHLIGLDLWCEYGKIHLSKDMTKEEALEAQKIYPDIKIIETQEPKKARKKKGAN